ncbi:MAG: ABC transporter ATP-binding protein [Gammaproteobacteria bacterium]|jgi:ABC-type microcin C transport system duplicated ATPase subunit YejF|nr:ABC transporter ATP-binding protein [Gammaproteobacteria bacterium]
MALLTVKDLHIHFHTRNGIVKAVNGVEFSLEKGETLGIVGESGSGKTVCCYSLLGLLPTPPARIESGSAMFEGNDLLNMSEQDLRKIRGNRIAMIFQDPMTSLNPFMKLGEQLTEPLTTHNDISKQEARKRAIAAMQEVGIPEPERRIDCYPHEFSGGMRQRVMIAMALVTEPDILIADEPTTALDVTIQAQILDLIKKLQRERSISVIFISHDLGVIAGCADKIIVMHEGNIVESGTTDEIYYQTKHDYTKKLLNAIPSSAKPESAVFHAEEGSEPIFKIDGLLTHFPISDGGVFSGKTDECCKAVDDVSLQLLEGETLGLVGESGCGKSTMAKSIMRLVDITAGSITLNGKDLTRLEGEELKTARAEFQMVFQDPYASLNPRMTVYDLLAEAIYVQKNCSKDELLKQVVSLMDDVGLPAKAIRKYPHEFSGGQRQRIAIARALALKPRLLIADEPVSALDVTIQAQILDLLLELVKKYQITMIFISHDLSVVRYLTDRTAVMYGGKIVEYGNTEDVFNNPQHLYTKSLLSAIPIADPNKERTRQRVAYTADQIA